MELLEGIWPWVLAHKVEIGTLILVIILIISSACALYGGNWRKANLLQRRDEVQVIFQRVAPSDDRTARHD